ncbi:MAG: signal peptidase I [Bacilli bacterium]|nr:signal peptidase I [Bacilli bacterium]
MEEKKVVNTVQQVPPVVEKKPVDKKKKIIKEILSYLAIILVVIIIRVFIFEPVRVDGPSMDSTLADGQVLILNKLRYKMTDIKRYDIVVVEVEEVSYNEKTKQTETEKTRIIKRVIGLPNEVIEIKNNKVYADGKELDNSFASSKSEDFDMSKIGLKKIPGDCYLVMGDNRAISLDSRSEDIGIIKKEQIIGRVTFRIWPLNKIGIVD